MNDLHADVVVALTLAQAVCSRDGVAMAEAQLTMDLMHLIDSSDEKDRRLIVQTLARFVVMSSLSIDRGTTS